MRDKIQNILNRVFKFGEKTRIKEVGDNYRFACPYCGDSDAHNHKKRGNIYTNTNLYECFNCGIRNKPVLQLFKDFNEGVNIKDGHQFKVKSLKRTANIDFSEIDDVTFSIGEICAKFNIYETTKNDPYLKKRFIQLKYKNVYKNDLGDYYFLNLVNDRVLGFEIKRALDGNYEKFTLNRLDKYLGRKIDDELISRYNPYSLMYYFFELDYDLPIYIFEGFVDASFIPNSVALGTAHKDITPFKYIDKENINFMLDNDKTGRKYNIKYLKQGYNVFMWEKFLDDFSINDKIKDFNDLLKYVILHKRTSVLKNLKTYFSNNIIDAYYV